MNNLKLGKLPAKKDERTIKLSTLFRVELLPPLPDSFDLDKARGLVTHPVFLNDQLGDCVIAATANMTRNFENFEQGKDPAITDTDVQAQYFKETSGADTGLVELDHLNTWRQDGFLVGDKVYKIHAFASVDWKNHTEVKYCIYLLNGIFLGLALPITAQSQLSSGVWTIVNPGSPDAVPGSWGYHAVIGQAFSPDSPVPPSPPTPPTPPKPGCLPGAVRS